MIPAAEANVRPSILRRLASMFYEMLLLVGVLAFTLIFPHALIAALTHHVATPVVFQAHFFLTLLVYFLWFWSRGRQTLAMKTWRIRLVTRDDLALQPRQALFRFLLCWPSIVLGGLGILWALIDRDKQFLHDRLAGTRLVQS